MQENPVLVSCKSLKTEYVKVKRIELNSREVSVGRGLHNDVVIPFISISRTHCVFRKTDKDEWTVEDTSAFGIQVNGHRLGKGVTRKISHEDILTLEPSEEFVYKFVDSSGETFEIPKKKIKLGESDNDFITNVKSGLEESQFSEIKHIEDKIQGAKQMQTTSIIPKDKLQLDMNRKVQQLESDFASQIENLKGEKNKALKELEELKRQREQELIEELNSIKINLEKQTEQQKLWAEQQLNEQKEHLQKLSNEDRIKMDQLMQDREEIQKKLTEAQSNAEKSIEQLKAQVHEREIELAALAADRIQQQAEQSRVVISSLQEQLEKVRSDLQSVETEKQTLLESICLADPLGEGTSTETALTKVGELMESELQCSICAELFVAATTLGCSHTFCKYCITMWKKKKKDCPICRSPLTSECKSLVLDSFIEKMVENLTDDMKKKREDLLKFREELMSQLARHDGAAPTRRSRSYDSSEDYNSDIDESQAEYEAIEEYYANNLWRLHQRYQTTTNESDTDNRPDYDSDASGESSSSSSGASTATSNAGGRTAGDVAGEGASAAPTPAVSNTPGQPERANSNDGVRRRERDPGIPGAYYGGYGRCFSCGARGHWAPGCPYR